MEEFLNNFYVQIPLHGYDISISKKVSLNKHNKVCSYQKLFAAIPQGFDE